MPLVPDEAACGSQKEEKKKTRLFLGKHYFRHVLVPENKVRLGDEPVDAWLRSLGSSVRWSTLRRSRIATMSAPTSRAAKKSEASSTMHEPGGFGNGF